MFVAKSSKRSTTSNTSKSKKDEPIKDKSQIKSQAAASPPTTLELRGVQIHFPFKPYKCQEDYMGKVLDALNGKENALLESPTGTGKTLCLLCSTLAWQQEQARLLADNNSHIDPDLDSKVDCASSNEQLPSTQAQPARTRTPTIIYASRTHSQLSQVVKEMRFTRYRPKHAVLGSREQMCVHPKVRTANATSADINHNCTSLNKERKCRFRNNLEGFVVNGCGADGGSSKGEQYEFGMQPVLDMEELVDLGKKRKVCPFYLSRGQIADADIIFVPYNYLFDKDARSNTLSEVCWEDAILVFDEAHNLESFASESASFDLSSVDIAGCVNEVARAIGYLQAMPEVGEGVKMENLIRLKSIFLQMEQYLENQVAPNGGSFTGEYIFEIFAKGANLNHSNHAVFLKFIKQVSDMVMEMRGGTGGSSSATTSGTPKLDHFVGCVKRVFGTATEGQSFANARAYRVHVSPKTSAQTGKSNSAGGGFVGHGNKPSSGRVLSYWCFAPSLAMHELAALNVRSILVTSGTLSPLPSYSLELGLPFPHTLENAHIIGKDQISVRVIGKGVSGKELTSTYNRRDNAEYISELGNTIISLAKVIPGGMLIFFPSYSVMENCIERWGGPLSSRSRTQNYGKKNFFQAKQKRESSSGNTGRNCFPHSALGYNQGGSATPWQRLMAVKAIVLEPKTTAELKDVIDEFDKFISLPKSSGCIMMGVCRGKISEGIDFADEKCRAVVITGLPFAPYLDPKVKLKREYLDGAKAVLSAKPSGDGGFDTARSNRTTCQEEAPIALSGAEWYSQQAHRAVNQAIGRVIRHRADYGAILFLDSRFSEARNQQGVSKWIRPSFEADTGVGGAIQSLVKFFRGAKAKAAADAQLTAKKQLVIAYEPDPNSLPSDKNGSTSAEMVTKISFVQKVAGSSDGKVAEDDLQGYVPPNRIIKHVNLNNAALDQKKIAQPVIYENNNSKEQMSRGLASLYKPNNRVASIGKVCNREGQGLSGTINSAWSETNQNNVRGKTHSKQGDEQKQVSQNERNSNQKELAQRFFQLAKTDLEPADFSIVRKLLVALKSSGDKKDVVAYLQHARKLISLLLQYDEPSLEGGQTKGDTLLDLLHSLLPVAYRLHIEEITCQLKIKKSLLYEKIAGSDESTKDLDLLMDMLPQLMMKNSPDQKSEHSRIRGLREVINVVVIHNVSTDEDIMNSLYSLLPMRLRNVARVLINEEKKRQKVDLLKERDRKIYGEEGINKTLFHKPTINHHGHAKDLPEKQPEEEVISKKESLFHANARNIHAQEQLSGKLEQSRERVAAMKKKNPYIIKKNNNAGSNKESVLENLLSVRPSKKARAMKDVVTTNSQTKSQTETDPLERLIRKAGTEIYRKSTPKVVRINRMLKTNAPEGTNCQICGKDSSNQSFFMAECNHFSCEECWTHWLARSNTCPTCRKPTNRENLSKVVFEQAAGTGAPSLTQICESSTGSSDDDENNELEIL